MAEHPNAVMVRQMLDAFNRGEARALEDFVTEDVVWHEIGSPEPLRGRAALAARAPGTVDYVITAKVHDVVANDGHTIALVEATATRGGKTFVYRTAEICHVRDGKISERWAFSDDTAEITRFFA